MDEYGNFVAVDDVKQNGKLTLGENAADNGGLRLAYMALDDALDRKDLKRNKLDGFTPEQRFFMAFTQVWGKTEPMNRLAWRRLRTRTRSSGLAIYLDVGDEDAFGLDEAAEFMHQVLWKNKIKHEYHLVRGANHLGRTLRPRSAEGLQFLGRVMNPPPQDPVAEDLIKRLAPLKKLN